MVLEDGKQVRVMARDGAEAETSAQTLKVQREDEVED
jgi:hypothetical protein